MYGIQKNLIFIGWTPPFIGDQSEVAKQVPGYLKNSMDV